MPVQPAEARSDAYYPKLFPEALERIRKAAAWLVAKEGPRVAIVSHSLGSWMTNAYFDETPDTPFRALGLPGPHRRLQLGRVFSPRPILDVYGESDLEPAVDCVADAASRSPRARTGHAR